MLDALRSVSKYFRGLPPGIITATMRKHTVYLVIILALTVLLFWRTFDLYFVADDFVFVKSARDLSFGDLLDVKQTLAYPGFTIFLYERLIPLFVLFKLDYTLWGLNATGYHLTNLILHLGCCVGVYGLAYLLTKKHAAALVSGLLFATHYAHVGGVAFVANRQAPTAGVFYILSMLCYIQYVQKQRSNLYYGLTLVAYTCTVLSYELGLTLPLLFFVYEFLFARKPLWPMMKDAVARYLPFGLIGVVYLAFYLSVQAEKQKVRISVQKLLYPIRYTLDLIVPFASAQFGPYVGFRAFLKEQLAVGSYVILGLLVVVLLAVLAGVGYLLWKSSKVIKFLIAWMYITLLLAFIAPYYAESLIYIPSVGFCIALAIGLFALFEHPALRAKTYQSVLKIGVIVVILATYSVITYTRIGWWEIGGNRTKQILTGIQQAVPTLPPNSCIFLADPPGHYNFVVPAFLNDEDLTSALQLVYNDATLLADRLFAQNGNYPEPRRIEISFGSRDCEPMRTYVFKCTPEGLERKKE